MSPRVGSNSPPKVGPNVPPVITPAATPTPLNDAAELIYSFVTETHLTPPKPPAKRPRYEEAVNFTELTSEEDIQEHSEHTTRTRSLLAIRYVSEPKSYEAAMKSCYAKQWRIAAEPEFASLMKNETWILVPPPNCRRVLQNRWVFVV
ncbi:unnamed protein product [Phytophthora fragariaefolia]|uniref:Unnamed protein product n=1 Tax=Phytophthora fragariaefolia TaxID=1490495 RepID=A0A9W6XY62_9STRA|nr:unnamed protein product [Phytophthora fragariaefolia]